MNASFDVVIVGGGVTGAAVGYGLAKRGVKTCLVDAVPTFSRASRANMGLIWCQSKALGCPQFVRWGFASSRAYGKLAAELKELSGIEHADRNDLNAAGAHGRDHPLPRGSRA